jgi:hypothetical protein
VRSPSDHCYACFTGRYPVALRHEDIHHEDSEEKTAEPKVGAGA